MKMGWYIDKDNAKFLVNVFEVDEENQKLKYLDSRIQWCPIDSNWEVFKWKFEEYQGNITDYYLESMEEMFNDAIGKIGNDQRYINRTWLFQEELMAENKKLKEKLKEMQKILEA